ncbi:MAG: glycosyltransferase [Bacteroidetes bacterium]|nr:MAG: glycosyltransferase [Bacteroidota bacterium]
MTRKALIIFQKNFVLGNVKTRIAKDIGEEEALRLYKWLVTKTLENCAEIESEKFIYYSDNLEDAPNEYEGKVQIGNDLGERMSNAFSEVFRCGYDRVVIIGTDCHSLNNEIIQDAFAALEEHDYVIGPSEDGGYYLLGMKKFSNVPFDRMTWSHKDVLTETLKRIGTDSVKQLRVLNDIDDKEDLLKSGLGLLVNEVLMLTI